MSGIDLDLGKLYDRIDRLEEEPRAKMIFPALSFFSRTESFMEILENYTVLQSSKGELILLTDSDIVIVRKESISGFKEIPVGELSKLDRDGAIEILYGEDVWFYPDQKKKSANALKLCLLSYYMVMVYLESILPYEARYRKLGEDNVNASYLDREVVRELLTKSINDLSQNLLSHIEELVLNDPYYLYEVSLERSGVIVIKRTNHTSLLLSKALKRGEL